MKFFPSKPSLILVASLLCFLSFQATFGSLASDRQLNRDILQLMVNDPKTAEKVFRLNNSFENRIYLSLLLGTKYADRPGSQKEIERLIYSLAKEVRAAGKDQPFFSFFTQVVDDPGTYYNNLAAWLRYLSVANDGRIGLLKEQIFIPCDLLIEHPSLRDVSSAAFGSSMDNYFPVTDCHKYRSRIPKSLIDYRNYIWKFSGTYQQETGTIRFAQALENESLFDRIALFPDDLIEPPVLEHDLKETPFKKHKLCRYPLFRWSLLGLWNWKKFQQSLTLYDTAKNELSAYYVRHFNMKAEKAGQTADIALRAQGFDGLWLDMRCPLESLRYAILNNSPVETIIQGLDSGQYDINEWRNGYPGSSPGFSDHYPGPPEPILHIAVLRPDILTELIKRGVPADQKNRFGKTPLMTAAQHNLLNSVEVLLDAGADVNAITRPKALRTFDQRTPLMYASSNASFAVINRLLEAGADVAAVDSRKNTALNYLDGIDPGLGLPKNPVLKEAEREIVQKKLSTGK